MAYAIPLLVGTSGESKNRITYLIGETRFRTRLAVKVGGMNKNGGLYVVPHLPHENGFANLTDTLQDTHEDGETKVYSKALAEDQAEIRPPRF